MRYDFSLEITDSLNTELFSKINSALVASGSVSNVVSSMADTINAQLDKTMNNKD